MSGTSPLFRGQGGLELAHETIALLGEHNIPTTPPNYEIWVSHKLGADSSLSGEIEARLASGEEFSDAVNEDLFERYFANTRLSVQMLAASEGIARELTDIVGTLRNAGDRAGSYSNALDSIATSFESGIDPASFQAVVSQLAAATREMADKNRQLSVQMAASSRQVEALQLTLQTVKVEALTDSLSGLANRKMFDESLRRSMHEAVANQDELCLLMCDIDHFKNVNDTWGHPVGDQVIRFIAHTLRQHANKDCLAARYGGEEFALIMPRTRLSEAHAIGCMVNQSVKTKRLARRSTGENIGSITISIGIAHHRSEDSLSDFIGRADACLYASKRGGRDRVTTDGDLASAA